MITKENCRELQEKAISVRRINSERRRLAALEALRNCQDKGFVDQALVRVRLQLDALFHEFMREMRKSHPDANKLDRIAAAQDKLGELEREYAGRPKMGSRRPTEEPRKPKPPIQLPQPVIERILAQAESPEVKSAE